MKLKHCSKCNQDLPRDSFTSTRAKYCIACKRIRQLEQQHASTLRRLERTKNKKQKKKTVLSISELKKSVQRKFNKWIRERDIEDGCISCGNKNASSYDAGHFWAMGSKSALRYNEDNCHKQCRSCNRFKHANLLEYRINLVKKIGIKKVDWLEEHRNDIKKWTREELEELLERYK